MGGHAVDAREVGGQRGWALCRYQAAFSLAKVHRKNGGGASGEEARCGKGCEDSRRQSVGMTSLRAIVLKCWVCSSSKDWYLHLLVRETDSCNIGLATPAMEYGTN